MDTVSLLGVKMTYLTLTVMVGEAFVGTGIAAAVLMARFHKGRSHQWLMIAAFLTDILVVKPLMIYRASQGVFGSFPYPNTPALPHISLAVAAASLGAFNIWLGYRFRVRSGKSMNVYLSAKGKSHRFVGAAFVASWSAAQIYGVWIFYTLYIRPF